MRWWHVLCIVIMSGGLLTACGADEARPRVKVQVVGDLATITPTMPPPTNTPPPTPLPSPTLEPTPRRVTVTRLDPNIDPAQVELLALDQPVPPIILTDIDGTTYALHELKGKVIIINFWTVGCGSCFYEFPLLQEIYANYEGDDLIILGVNVSDFAEETRALADGLGIDFPQVVDPAGEVFTTYFGGAVVPTTYFIAADGTVFDVVVGPLDRHTLLLRLTALGVQ